MRIRLALYALSLSRELSRSVLLSSIEQSLEKMCEFVRRENSAALMLEPQANAATCTVRNAHLVLLLKVKDK